jgi:hypothetical protein
MADKKREPSCTNNHDVFRRMLRNRGFDPTPCPSCGWLLSPARPEPPTAAENLVRIRTILEDEPLVRDSSAFELRDMLLEVLNEDV